MQERIITKVSVSDKISIKFDQCDRTQLTLTSEDEALSSFYDTTGAFLSTLIESAGLDSGSWQDGEVLSITLKYSDAGTAIAISGRCNIEGKYSTVSSPSRIAEDCQQALIDKLCKEAIAYLDGDRSQQNLLGSVK